MSQHSLEASLRLLDEFRRRHIQRQKPRGDNLFVKLLEDSLAFEYFSRWVSRLAGVANQTPRFLPQGLSALTHDTRISHTGVLVSDPNRLFEEAPTFLQLLVDLPVPSIDIGHN